MSRGQNQKFKFPYLMKIMQAKTDDQHSLTMPQIMEELDKYDVTAERKSTGIFRQISYDFSGCWGWIYDVYGCFSNIIPIRNYVKSIFCFLFVPSVPSHSYRLLCVAKWLILRASIYHYFSWRFSRKCFSV